MKAWFPRTPQQVNFDSRTSNLFATRRWLLLLLLSEALLFASLVGIVGWRKLSTAEKLFLAVSLIFVAAGWLYSRYSIGLWLLTCGPLMLVFASLFNSGNPSDLKWIAVSTSAGHVAYALVLLTRPVWGMVSIILCTIGLAFTWSHHPSNVVPGALIVADGKVSLVSLAFSAVVLWSAWHLLFSRAREEDASKTRLEMRIQLERETQERSRALRAAAISVHERLLSTLRYLIQTDDPDRAALRAFLSTTNPLDLSTSNHDLAQELRVATAARIASGIVQLDPSIIDLPVSSEARSAGRAAIVECALNAVLHGGATEVRVTAEADRENVRVHIIDNGRGITETAKPGLGWNSVLGQGLADVDGSWTFSSEPGITIVTITLPSAHELTTSVIMNDDFEQGRVLLSAPLLAVGAVGLAFDAIGITDLPLRLFIIALGLFGVIVGSGILLKRVRPHSWITSAALLSFATTPWLVKCSPELGSSITQIAPGLVTAGYALIAIALWCQRWQFITSLAIWALGMIALAMGTSDDNRQAIFVGLINCLVIVPVVLIVASIATRRFHRTQNALLLQRDAMNAEIIRANAALVIENQLAASLALAESTIAQIAEGAALDEERKRELSCLEGLIRATIQVDPISSGEFARVAARLCNSAFSKSIPAQVGTLISSADLTPLPYALLAAIEKSISSAQSVAIRALTSADEDFLSILLFGEEINDCDLITIPSDDQRGISVTTEVEEGEYLLIMVGRKFKHQELPSPLVLEKLAFS